MDHWSWHEEPESWHGRPADGETWHNNDTLIDKIERAKIDFGDQNIRLTYRIWGDADETRYQQVMELVKREHARWCEAGVRVQKKRTANATRARWGQAFFFFLVWLSGFLSVYLSILQHQSSSIMQHYLKRKHGEWPVIFRVDIVEGKPSSGCHPHLIPTVGRKQKKKNNV